MDPTLIQKLLDDISSALARPEVTEFVVAAGRLPSARVRGAYEPTGSVATPGDLVFQLLVKLGGSRYLESLGPQPVSWRTRLPSSTAVQVVALERDGVLQARIAPNREAQAGAGTQDPPSSRRGEARPAAAAAPKDAAVAAPKDAKSPTLPDSPRAKADPEPNRSFEIELDVGPQTSRRPATRHTAAYRADTMPEQPIVDPSAVALDPSPAIELATAAETTAPFGTPAFAFDARALDFQASPPGANLAAATAVASAQASPPVALQATTPAVSPVANFPVSSAADRHAGRDADGDGLVDAQVASLFARVNPAATQALDALLAEARQKGASDLHLVSGRPPLFRIGGEIVPGGTVLGDDAVAAMLLSAIPERLRASFAADGSCDFARTHPSLGRFRVNVTKQRTGLKGSFRLVGLTVPTLKSLGLPEAIAQATHHHQGLIVVTGPTGHGKTTTLAALVDIINSDTTHHVITVEDPIEYVHPRKRAMISQREVGTHTKSFQAALKASLREDPDVVVVGELRDTETVRMALSASETGHLVIGTMNTPSAAKTIDRLIDLFPPGDQAQVRTTLAGGLRLIVSQRLVRSSDGTRMVAAVEVLPGSVALWNLIRDQKTYQIPSLQQRGKAMGIVRLDDSLADLVRSGQVTLEAARSLAEAPDELAQTVRGAAAPATGAAVGTRG